MPITIKRYPNRKLYNTDTKRYITLDGIAELIRDGESVQVVDHTTNEDLTSLTLSQIIFEQEKKKSGFLPCARSCNPQRETYMIRHTITNAPTVM